MGKKLVISLLLFLVFVSAAYAETDPAKKLFRGLTNIITAPIEMPKQVRAYWIEGAQRTDHILVWISSGVVWGIIQGVKRSGSGIWDVVSFPFEKPSSYEPLLKPAFVFDQWPRNPTSGL